MLGVKYWWTVEDPVLTAYHEMTVLAAFAYWWSLERTTPKYRGKEIWVLGAGLVCVVDHSGFCNIVLHPSIWKFPEGRKNELACFAKVHFGSPKALDGENLSSLKTPEETLEFARAHITLTQSFDTGLMLLEHPEKISTLTPAEQ